MLHLTVYYLLIQLTTLTQFTAGFGKNLIEVANEGRSRILCPMALLQKYFQYGVPLSGSVISMSLTSASLNIQEDLLNAMHAQVEVPWSVVVNNPHQPSTSVASAMVLHEKPQCYFIVVKNLEDGDLEDIFVLWKTSINWNPLAQFVVYLTSIEKSEEEMTELMIEILLLFMNKKIYNVNVIGRNEESRFFYGKTVFPYHPDNNCGNRVIAVETLDVCDFENVGDANYDEEYDGEDEVDFLGGNKNVDDNEYSEDDNGIYNEDKIENKDEDDRDSNEDKDRNPYEELKEQEDKKEAKLDKKVVTMKKNEEKDEGAKVKGSSRKEDKEDKSQDQRLNRGSKCEFEEEKDCDEKDSRTQKEKKNIEVTDDKRVFIQELYPGLFLDKFPKDLSGCPVVAAYRSLEPYIFKEANENGKSEDAYENKEEADIERKERNYGGEKSSEFNESDKENDDNSYNDMDAVDIGDEPVLKLNGIEYQLVQTISELLHITIDFQLVNGNIYQLFQQLIDGDIEMLLGGIDEDPSISQFVSSSIAYHQDDLTWCVAKAKRKHDLFNFLHSFHISTWLFTLGFIFVASLNIFFAQKLLPVRLVYFGGFFRTFVRIFGIILSQSTFLKRLPSSLHITFGSVFIMAMLFVNVYQSFLVSTLTTPKSLYQISHVDEIYRNRMIVTGSGENVRHLNKDGETFKYIRENFQMCYNIEECLNHAATDERIAAAVSRQHSFYNPRIRRDELYCFDRNENLYAYLVTILLPKKYHLLHKINPIIQYVIESGQMQKWAGELDMKRKIREEIERARKVPVKGLTINQVFGSFALHAMLAALTFLIFLLECWTHWMVTKRRTRWKLVKLIHRKLRQI